MFPTTPLVLTGLFLAAYFVGSVPFSLLIGRWAGGIDLRNHGSGNVGATNVGRLLGWRWGLLALLLDAIKGLAPTGLGPRLFDASRLTTHVAVGCGVAAILGHMFPCWLRFRGGKGVATSLGVILMLQPLAALAAAAGFAICFAWKRIVSLSSIVAACVFAAVALADTSHLRFSSSEWSLTAFNIAVPLLVIFRHRSNIVRLLRGEERRFSAGAPGPPGDRTVGGPTPPTDSRPGG